MTLPAHSLEQTHCALLSVPSRASDRVPLLPPVTLPSPPHENLQLIKNKSPLLVGEEVLDYHSCTNLPINAELIYKTGKSVIYRLAYLSDSSDDKHLGEDGTPRIHINQRVTSHSSLLGYIYGPSRDELRRVLPRSSANQFTSRQSSSYSQPSPNIDDILNNTEILAHVEQQIKKRNETNF